MSDPKLHLGGGLSGVVFSMECGAKMTCSVV